MVYAVLEHIISPIGIGCEYNFDEIQKGRIALDNRKTLGAKKLKYPIGKIENHQFVSLFSKMLSYYAEALGLPLIESKEFKLIITTTKGGVEDPTKETLLGNIDKVLKASHLYNEPTVISNACVSGVMGINLGASIIQKGIYNHVLVIGIDIITDFILKGFECLYALSDEFCKPFDKNRKGINLGDCAAGILLTNDKNLSANNTQIIIYKGGASANDANHISGPSRTGEGLYQSIQKSLINSNISKSEIDFISAHGTATNYNDEMESIAFSRHQITQIPLNSLKAYFGHTLGAAGVLETNLSIMSLRKQQLIISKNYEEVGTTHPLNIIQDPNPEAPLRTFLKTSSGFGGINSSLIFSTEL